jgi:hypothetical protein
MHSPSRILSALRLCELKNQQLGRIAAKTTTGQIGNITMKEASSSSFPAE